jgi:chromosome segregation ATPase
MTQHLEKVRADLQRSAAKHAEIAALIKTLESQVEARRQALGTLILENGQDNKKYADGESELMQLQARLSALTAAEAQAEQRRREVEKQLAVVEKEDAQKRFNDLGKKADEKTAEMFRSLLEALYATRELYKLDLEHESLYQKINKCSLEKGTLEPHMEYVQFWRFERIILSHFEALDQGYSEILKRSGVNVSELVPAQNTANPFRVW